MKCLVRKPYRITIRLSTDEFDVLKERAKKAGRPLSAYVRATSLGKMLHEKPQDEFMDYLRSLNRMSTNLNQIAARVNTYKYLDEKQMKRIIEELETFIDEARKKYIGSG